MTKIHKINGHLVAFSGNLNIGISLLEWFRAGFRPADYPGCDVGDESSSLLVITPERKILAFESNKPVAICFEGEWHTRGSGGDFASAAFMMGADPARAVEVACELDIYSGGGIDVLSLD